MLKSDSVKIKRNVLSREKCAEIIADADAGKFERDVLKRDALPQSELFDKETLDSNTKERSVEKSYQMGRKVSQSPGIDPPIFPEWDGNPVYRCKVMKYETGDYLHEHYDAKWMCLSNYWAPDTNMISQSITSIALNDDYEGGEFTVEGEIINQEVGSAVTVPQHALDHTKSAKHGVRRVTSGTRYALVFWNFA